MVNVTTGVVVVSPNEWWKQTYCRCVCEEAARLWDRGSSVYTEERKSESKQQWIMSIVFASHLFEEFQEVVGVQKQKETIAFLLILSLCSLL